MSGKGTYGQLFRWSFLKRTQIIYQGGTVKEYEQGSGDLVPKIVSNEKTPVKGLPNDASLALGKVYTNRKVEIGSDAQVLIYDVYNQKDSFLYNAKFIK